MLLGERKMKHSSELSWKQSAGSLRNTQSLSENGPLEKIGLRLTCDDEDDADDLPIAKHSEEETKKTRRRRRRRRREEPEGGTDGGAGDEEGRKEEVRKRAEGARGGEEETGAVGRNGRKKWRRRRRWNGMITKLLLGCDACKERGRVGKVHMNIKVTRRGEM